MTTRVVLFNTGPESVKVEIQGRDAGGKFVADKEQILPPLSGGEFYLHSHQSLQLIEITEENPNG